MYGEKIRRPRGLKRVLKNPVWGPQEWESPYFFEAFVIYRDTPIEKQRSIKYVFEELAARFEGEKTPSERTIGLWSYKYKWEERALAYDRYLDGMRMQQVKRRVAEMQERHSGIAVAMTSLVVQRLRTLNANDLTPRDIREWMDVATRIELRARGENTDNIGIQLIDGREQQIERAKEFYQKMTLESPQLGEADKAAIIQDAFDVQPHELGLSPNLLDAPDSTIVA